MKQIFMVSFFVLLLLSSVAARRLQQNVFAQAFASSSSSSAASAAASSFSAVATASASPSSVATASSFSSSYDVKNNYNYQGSYDTSSIVNIDNSYDQVKVSYSDPRSNYDYQTSEFPQAQLPNTKAQHKPYYSDTKSSTDSYTPISGVCSQLEHKNLPVYWLTQEDFKFGSKIIKEPGYYKLEESIDFNPNSMEMLGVDAYSAGDVQPYQFGEYNMMAFGIGFFAAIVVEGSDIVIDLNGKMLQQSHEHILQQRVFAGIELASAPFIPTQGPHDFGSIKSASNVCIKNGRLGRTHHGIHGNNNRNIEIQDLRIQNYEVAAIHLNKGEDIVIQNIYVPNARENVPVLGRFSAARYIRPWINRLADHGYNGTLNINGRHFTASKLRDDLRYLMNSVVQEVLSSGRIQSRDESFEIFANQGGLPNGGTAYGIVLNGNGFAVNGFPVNIEDNERSKRVQIQNVQIDRIRTRGIERPALRPENMNEPIVDAVGAVFVTDDDVTVTNDGRYIGNTLANVQLLVGKAIGEGFDFGNLNPKKNSISDEVIRWAESGLPRENFGLKYICNTDHQFHVNKGIVAFKLDGLSDVTCTGCNVKEIVNNMDIGSTRCNDNMDYKNSIGISHPGSTDFGFTGANVRGFSVSDSHDVKLQQCSVGSAQSSAGSVFGIDIAHGSSNVVVEQAEIGFIRGGTGHDLHEYVDNPTDAPIQEKIRLDESTANVRILQTTTSEY